MNLWTCIIAVFLGSGSLKLNTTSDLELVRKNYSLAVLDKKVCREMIKELGNDHANTTTLAYLGGFQTIWARLINNPLSKLKTFYRGKANIEEALKEDANNPEIRFIRLSVQENCPSFLGYHSNIKEDRYFLKMNRGKIKSPVLNEMVASILNNK